MPALDYRFGVVLRGEPDFDYRSQNDQ